MSARARIGSYSRAFRKPWHVTFLRERGWLDYMGVRRFTRFDERLHQLGVGLLLHDIGKLGVSNLILDKPGKPTDEEFVEIRKHPDYTAQVLEQVGAFGILSDVASAHHERLESNCAQLRRASGVIRQHGNGKTGARTRDSEGARVRCLANDQPAPDTNCLVRNLPHRTQHERRSAHPQ